MFSIPKGTPAGWLTGCGVFAAPVFLILSVPSWRQSMTGMGLAFVFGFISISALVLAGREHWLGEGRNEGVAQGRTQALAESEKARVIASAAAVDTSLPAPTVLPAPTSPPPPPAAVAAPEEKQKQLAIRTPTREEISLYLNSLPLLQVEQAAKHLLRPIGQPREPSAFITRSSPAGNRRPAWSTSFTGTVPSAAR